MPQSKLVILRINIHNKTNSWDIIGSLIKGIIDISQRLGAGEDNVGNQEKVLEDLWRKQERPLSPNITASGISWSRRTGSRLFRRMFLCLIMTNFTMDVGSRSTEDIRILPGREDLLILH